MPQYWDRLINRAKMFDSENDFSYEKKLQRAIMILYGVDPDVLPEEDIPMQLCNFFSYEKSFSLSNIFARLINLSRLKM